MAICLTNDLERIQKNSEKEMKYSLKLIAKLIKKGMNK